MSFAVGFNPMEDYVLPLSTVPLSSSCNDHVDKEDYRLDEWDWDETLALEKSDILRTVNRNCDLITVFPITIIHHTFE
jgi:hypothetical protein